MQRPSVSDRLVFVRKYNQYAYVKTPVARCICEDNSKGLLRCLTCAFEFIGYLREVCEQHPNVHFLNSYSHCPMCRLGRMIKKSDI